MRERLSVVSDGLLPRPDEQAREGSKRRSITLATPNRPSDRRRRLSRGLRRPAGAGEQGGVGAGAGGAPLSLRRWACQLLRQSLGEPPQRR
jgi:hypothetical protein